MTNEGKLSTPRLLIFMACIIFALGSLGAGIWLHFGDTEAGGVENRAYLPEHFRFSISNGEVTIWGLHWSWFTHEACDDCYVCNFEPCYGCGWCEECMSCQCGWCQECQINQVVDVCPNTVSGIPADFHLDIPTTINGYPVRHIAQSAFVTQRHYPNMMVDLTNITQVTLPQGLQTIGQWAFANRVGTLDNYNAFKGGITAINFPDSLRRIERQAFDNQSLEALNLPEGIEYIGLSAFSSNHIAGTLVIPESITHLGAQAFTHNFLTSVVIPPMATIPRGLFSSNNLTHVNIPEGVVNIDQSAFSGNNLTSITFPKTLTTIGSVVFFNNQLTTITLPENLTYIGDSAFGSNLLTSLNIPADVVHIGARAFSQNQLTVFPIIPIGVTVLRTEVFSWNLFGTVIIPNHITTIERVAFFGNPNLETVFIPNSVTQMGDQAFNDSGVLPVRIYVEHPSRPSNWNEFWSIRSAIPNHHTVIWGASNPFERVITFDARGGTATNTIRMVPGLTFTLPSTSRTGADFLGWATTLDENDPSHQFFPVGSMTFTLTEDKKLYAIWHMNVSTLTFTNLYDGTHANGDNGSNSRTITIEDLPLTLLPADRPGFNFLGWFVPNPPGSYRQVTEFTTWISDTTLIAKWSDPIKSNITFMNIIAGDIHENPFTFDADDLPITLQPVTREGWTFRGWYSEATFEYLVSQITVAGDRTLFARLTPNQFVITFENLQGTTPNNETTFTIDSSTHILVNPSAREGWSFEGWWTEEGGQGTRWTSVPVGTIGSQTLYAYWTLQTHFILFRNLYNTSHQNQSSFNRETQTITLHSPSARRGFAFEGWYTTSTFDEGTRITAIATGTSSDIVLYARWAVVPGEEPCLYPNPCDCEVCTGEAYTPTSWFRDNLNWILFALAAMFTVLALLILLAKRNRNNEEAEQSATK